jgi:hypothetical protein
MSQHSPSQALALPVADTEDLFPSTGYETLQNNLISQEKVKIVKTPEKPLSHVKAIKKTNLTKAQILRISDK